MQRLSSAQDALIQAIEHLLQIPAARDGFAQDGELHGHRIDGIAQLVDERANGQAERVLGISPPELPQLFAGWLIHTLMLGAERHPRSRQL
ncbi:hypothetical protein ENSA7_07050 [Enhygromyxa salina]|uniref:Uncharacterized protein n=1 Tax=Enhygromyxa salina TaxID=215803 RepID=A0A2S9YX26_9BACT|nr:hypothetical protein ENSA7_07050 [Enhygromyxa salina]